VRATRFHRSYYQGNIRCTEDFRPTFALTKYTDVPRLVTAAHRCIRKGACAGLLEPARAYRPYWKGTTACVGAPAPKVLLGPIDMRLPLLTEAIPVGATALRRNATVLAAPVT